MLCSRAKAAKSFMHYLLHRQTFLSPLSFFFLINFPVVHKKSLTFSKIWKNVSCKSALGQHTSYLTVWENVPAKLRSLMIHTWHLPLLFWSTFLLPVISLDAICFLIFIQCEFTLKFITGVLKMSINSLRSCWAEILKSHRHTCKQSVVRICLAVHEYLAKEKSLCVFEWM